MMIQWELARYLIDAKKSIDTILFINRYKDKISPDVKKEKIDNSRKQFYINLVVILDNYCELKNIKRKQKTSFISSNVILERIKYERDKHEAHKDVDFKPRNYSTFEDMIADMKCEIEEIKKVCKDVLPQNITLDYIPYDRSLFRAVYGITYDREQRLMANKYKGFIDVKNVKKSKIFSDEEYSIFSDTEEINRLENEEKEKQVVVIENGLNILESFQNKQDAFIRLNVLKNENIWCFLSNKDIKFLDLFLTLYEEGVLEVNDIPKDLSIKNIEALAERLESVNK